MNGFLEVSVVSEDWYEYEDSYKYSSHLVVPYAVSSVKKRHSLVRVSRITYVVLP
jgi:hypothetical protein